MNYAEGIQIGPNRRKLIVDFMSRGEKEGVAEEQGLKELFKKVKKGKAYFP